MKKFLPIILAVLVIALVYFWQAKQGVPESGDNEHYDWTLNFEFQDDYAVEASYGWPSSVSLLEMTQEIAKNNSWTFDSEDYGEMGVLITQIQDKENGQQQKYWQYFVDGEQPQLSADKYYPPDNTHIDWIFAESKF